MYNCDVTIEWYDWRWINYQGKDDVLLIEDWFTMIKYIESECLWLVNISN